MKTFINAISVIFIIALVLIIAPTLFEILAFFFVLFLQIVVVVMVSSFLFNLAMELFEDNNNGQKAWEF